jgi:hypothetical protein
MATLFIPQATVRAERKIQILGLPRFCQDTAILAGTVSACYHAEIDGGTGPFKTMERYRE